MHFDCLIMNLFFHYESETSHFVGVVTLRKHVSTVVQFLLPHYKLTGKSIFGHQCVAAVQN